MTSHIFEPLCLHHIKMAVLLTPRQCRLTSGPIPAGCVTSFRNVSPALLSLFCIKAEYFTTKVPLRDQTFGFQINFFVQNRATGLLTH